VGRSRVRAGWSDVPVGRPPGPGGDRRGASLGALDESMVEETGHGPGTLDPRDLGR